MKRARVAVVDERGEIEAILRDASQSIELRFVADVRALLALAARREADVAVVAPGARVASVLREVERGQLELPLVLVLERASSAEAVEAAVQSGHRWLVAPEDGTELLVLVRDALAPGRSSSKSRAETPNAPARDLRAEELARLSYRQALNLARHRAAREYLVALMDQYAGNVARAAERAGIERESLHRLLRRYGLRSGGDSGAKGSG